MEQISLLSSEQNWESYENTQNNETQNITIQYEGSSTSGVDDNIVIGSSNETCADVELIQNISNLPEGKDKYFFVSSSNVDADRVWSIIKQLETRFKLSCVYWERDFQPGKNIQESIKEGMARSLKVLLFITPNFHQSLWCMFEREYAFWRSIQNKNYCIIPVKLEDCEIPTALAPMKYIDAALPGVDVPAKIASALIHSGTNEQDGFLPREYPSSIKRYENGYCFAISAGREKTLVPCRPSRYKFQPSQELLNKQRNNNVQIPDYVLHKSLKVINSDSVMWSYDFLSRCNICCWWILLFLIAFLALLVGHTTSRVSFATGTRLTVEEYTHKDDVDTASAFLFMFWPFISIILMCCIPRCCHRRTRDISLQRKIWRRFGDEFISNNVLLLFTGRNKRPRLLFMRYNFLDCKNHLKAFILEKYPMFEDKFAEKHALSYMKKYVEEILPVLADDFDSLPEAPYNRHNVRKGKICLCQYLEDIV